MRVLARGLVVCACLGAQEWPQFRGLNGSGVGSSTATAPTELNPEKALWRIDMPTGHSSPIVTGNRLILTAVEGGARKQVAPGRVVDPEGKVKKADLNQERSTIKSPAVVDCSIKVLQGIKFPPSSRGMDTTVNYPFNFN